MLNIDYINIEKKLIPYSFDITLEGTTYTIDVNYNQLNDFFTLNLLRNGEVIVLGEKLVYGKPLFLSALHKEVPDVSIIPYDLSEKATEVTFDNLGENVYLYMVGG